MFPRLIFAFTLTIPALPSRAQVDFRKEVRPLLNKHCTACHGGVKKAGGLSFLNHADVLAETDSGVRAVVPGKPEASEMLRRLALPSTDDDHMPPLEHGPSLSAADQATLRNWIQQGAQWNEHWAYELPVATKPPTVKNAAWPKSPLDAFVLARIESASLAPEPPQEKSRWLRRVSLDLTGLPPNPEIVQAFLADNKPGAAERQIDALLASSAYGERWAALWLDLVRYADSKGLGQDRNRLMWPYRDWVIKALNADMPFDEFTKKQLAGDMLPKPGISDLVATTCHRLTANNDEGGTDDEEFRVEAIHDRVSTTWQVWQGITFGCAQCHDHPYDPFTHQDYYRFFAIFNQGQDSDTEADYPVLRVPKNDADAGRAAQLDLEISGLKKKIHVPSAAMASQKDGWRFLTQLNPKSDRCGATVEKRESREEWKITGTIPIGVNLTVEAELPPDQRELTALRLHALPGDLKDGLKLSEWGFVMEEFRAEILSGPDGKEKQSIRFVAAFSDEAEPRFDPLDSLPVVQPLKEVEPKPAVQKQDAVAAPQNDKEKAKVAEKAKPKDKPKSVPNPPGWSAHTRIHREHWAVFVPEKPIALPPGAKLRLSMSFPSSGEGAHPMLIKRGAIAVTADPGWQTYLKNADYQSAMAGIKTKTDERMKIPAETLPIMRDIPSGQQRGTQLFVRGNWMTRGEETPPGVPKFMRQPKSQVDRMETANWLVGQENPLTARVMVNRLWEQLFGTGIVETIEDLGSSGEAPSHPELLDWLALRLQNEHRWSLKKMLRDLVLSASYGQDNTIAPQKLAKDPQNRLISRGPRLRLTAEMLRDQALSVTDMLTNKLYGPPVYPPLPSGVWDPFVGGEKWPTAKPGDPDRYRRSIYTQVKRSIPNPMSSSFDAPSREVCTQRRISSNTPVQALTMLNDEVFQEITAKLAAEMQTTAGRERPDNAKGISAGYQRLLSRPIPPGTLQTLLDLWQKTVSQGATSDSAWKNIALVLLNQDEFLTR